MSGPDRGHGQVTNPKSKIQNPKAATASRRVILVRHAETEWNRERRNQGRSDIALNELGRRQAQQVALRLRDEPIALVCSSPLQRAMYTARAIAEPHGLRVRIEPGLRELDQGDLEGLTFEELRRRHGDLIRAWTADPTDVLMPGGETMRQVQERAWEVVARALAHDSTGAVVLVSHALTITSILCRALDMALARGRRMRHAVTGVTILHTDGRTWTLATLNDTCHLAGEPPG